MIISIKGMKNNLTINNIEKNWNNCGKYKISTKESKTSNQISCSQYGSSFEVENKDKKEATDAPIPK